MAAGRPTAYSKKKLETAQEYLDGGFESQGDVVPTIAGLACYLGASKDTLYHWGERNKKFLDTLDAIKYKQERMLAAGGLSNSYNATIVKLMLANHGYSDKIQTDNAHQVAGDLAVNVNFVSPVPSGNSDDDND